MTGVRILSAGPEQLAAGPDARESLEGAVSQRRAALQASSWETCGQTHLTEYLLLRGEREGEGEEDRERERKAGKGECE